MMVVLSATSSAQVQFEDVTTSAGIDYWGESWGASWGDLNGDGLPDIFVNHHRAPPSLHVNQGDGRFLDITATTYWNNPAVIGDMHGGSWADFDNDGDQDFYVTHGGKNLNHFMVNVNGELIYQTPQYDLQLTSWRGRLPVWLDFTNDGLLDYLVTSENTAPVAEQSANTFINRTVEAGTDCNKRQMAYLVDVSGDGALDLICTGAIFPGAVYDFRMGVPFTELNGVIPNTGATQDVAIGDFDGNLQNDFFLVRGAKRLSGADQVDSNTVAAQLITIGGGEKRSQFVTDGDLTIRLVVEREFSGSDVAIGSAGWNPDVSVTKVGGERTMVLNLSSSDPNTVGIQPHDSSINRDVFIGYEPTTQTWTIVNSPGGLWTFLSVEVASTSPVSGVSASGLNNNDRPIRPVLMSNRTGGFSDLAIASGLSDPLSCVSTVAADFDNDMDMDIYAVCRGANFNVANRYFDNDGNGDFTEVPFAGDASGPVGPGVGKGETVVTADYDVDGNVDLFVTNGMALNPERIGGPDLLFRNLGHASNNWIQFDLVGAIANRDGIGARVLVTAAGTTQLREQGGGYHRWSQNDKRLHFGLGPNSIVDVSVEWPSGTIDTYEEVFANSVYKVNEGGEIVEFIAGQAPVPIASLSPAVTSTPEAGGSVQLSIDLSAAANSPVSLSYQTVAGSAVAGEDFVAVSDLVNFAPGETSQSVSIAIVDDAIPEALESLSVELVDISGPATLGQSVSTLNIQNDDGPFAEIAIGDASADEDTGTIDFVVTLTELVVGNVDFAIDTVDGTATVGNNDYVPLIDFSGSVSEGSLSTTVSVVLVADTAVETDENFMATLTMQSGSADVGDGIAIATIVNDDFLPPSISLSDAAANEDSGKIEFDITLSDPAIGSVDFTVSTDDGTATVTDGDYVGLFDFVGTIPDGQTATTVSVALGGDMDVELNEFFTVSLSLASTNVMIADGDATGTILNDDSVGVPQEFPLVDWRFVEGDLTLSTNQIVFASAVDVGWKNQVNSASLMEIGFAGEYEVLFEIVGDPADSLWVVGLGIDESGPSRTDVDYGFRVSNGELQLRRNGNWISNAGTVSVGDVLSLAVSGGNVDYRLNGASLFTSIITDPPDLYVDSAFRRGAGALNVTVFGDPTVAPPPPNNGAIVDWANAAGGVSASGDTLTFSGAPTGWVNSINSAPMSSIGAGSSYTVSWTIETDPTTANWVVGFGTVESDTARTDVEYGLRNVNGALQIRENGLWRSNSGEISVGDKVGLRVNGTILEFLLNDVAVYSLPISDAEDFYIDTAFKNGAAVLGSFFLADDA